MSRGPKVSPKVLDALQGALDAEMAGVALYTHLAFRVFGPQMQGIVAHLRKNAEESLGHAQAVGDRLTTLGGVPRIRVEEEIEHSPTTLEEILRISLVHERKAIELYRNLMDAAAGDVALEDFARSMVAAETDHATELEKMLRPMG